MNTLNLIHWGVAYHSVPVDLCEIGDGISCYFKFYLRWLSEFWYYYQCYIFKL